MQNFLERSGELTRAAWDLLVTGAPLIYQEVNATLAEHPLLQFAADAMPVLLSLIVLAFGAFRWIVTQTQVATTRKATGDKIVILVARFHGDRKNRLQRLLNASVCEDLIEHDSTAVQSFKLPRRFATELSGRKHEQAKRKAQRWLERKNGDVLIWGDDLSEGAGYGCQLFFAGRNKERQTFVTQTLDLMADKSDFIEGFLAVVEHELTAVRDRVLAEPETASQDVLERFAAKYEALANSSSKALPEAWKRARAQDAQRMRNELIRRMPVEAEEPDEPIVTEADLEALDPDKSEEALLWAQTALALATQERRRAFYDVDPAIMQVAIARLEKAETILLEEGAPRERADCLFEQALCRIALRETLPCPSDVYDDAANAIQACITAFEGCVPVDFAATDDGFAPAHKPYAARLLLLHALWHDGTESWQRVKLLASNVFQLLAGLDRLGPLLDPEAECQLIYKSWEQAFSAAQKSGNVPAMSWLVESSANWRSSGRAPHLDQLLALRHAAFAWELDTTAGNLNDGGYQEFRRRTSKAMTLIAPLLSGKMFARGTLFEAKLAETIGRLISWSAKENASEDRMVEILDRLTSIQLAVLDRYPYRYLSLMESTIVALNNIAHNTDSLVAAERSYSLAQTHLSLLPNSIQAIYILAYAAHQRARLIDPSDSHLRDRAAMEAWSLLERLYEQSLQAGDRSLEDQAIAIMRELQDLFPSLFANDDLSIVDPEYFPRQNISWPDPTDQEIAPLLVLDALFLDPNEDPFDKLVAMAESKSADEPSQEKVRSDSPTRQEYD